ncbi:DUF535 family protein [Campylobacter sp. VTCC 70190]|uniref:DUF535 family protein n=1 Tax=Campylobacter sp. VTCC 70190 TaxID=3392118 RepID=UPI00398ECE7E
MPNFDDPKRSIVLKRKMRYYLRHLLFFSYKTKFEKFLILNPHLQEFCIRNSWILYSIYRDFCDISFNVKERYENLTQDLLQGYHFFQGFLTQPLKIYYQNNPDEIEIFLGCNGNSCEEGFWNISICYNHQTIYQLSYCFTAQKNLLIACVQGIKGNFDNIKINKILTKQCYGLRPSALLIECAKMLCEILKFQMTLGIYENTQLRHGKSKDKGYFVDYKKIWLENGGELVKINKHKYYKLSHTRKNIEEIPSQKRSMYKKRFAMLEELRQNLIQVLS